MREALRSRLEWTTLAGNLVVAFQEVQRGPSGDATPVIPAPVVTKPSPPPPITTGTVVNDRYDIRQSLGKGGMGEVFLAFDRSTQQTVALKVVREESRMPGDDEALRQELLLARSVSHPNVCRVHDLAPSPWGPILVMEQIPGQTLHTHIRKKKAQGGYTADEFRKIASEVCAGLAAIHNAGPRPRRPQARQRHGLRGPRGDPRLRLRAGARPRLGAKARRPARWRHAQLHVPGAPPQRRREPRGRRLRDGLTLWEMWTCRVPEPGYKPRVKTMKQQIMFDVPAGLSIDEVRQIFRGLNEDPQMRPQARHMRFFNPTQLTTSPIQLPRERLDPGPPPGRAVVSTFTPGAQSLLVTYATNAPEIVGQLLPLDKPLMSLGRRGDQDLVMPEATVSGTHAVLRWQSGSWLIEDLGSTNGSYTDYNYERKTQVALMHGGEAQVGECRLKLVSFAPESPQHKRARQYLASATASPACSSASTCSRPSTRTASSATGPRRRCRSPATSCAAPTAR
jgi:hypothetical protein